MQKQYAVKLEMIARENDSDPLSTFVKCLESWKIPKNKITSADQLYVWEDKNTVFRWDPCKIDEDIFVDFVIREQDPDVQGRYWTSQISAYSRSDRITASIEISTIDLIDGIQPPFAANRPKIINIFANKFECYIGAGLLSGSSKPIYREDAADFVRFSIRDIYRKDPILIVYPIDDGKYPIWENNWVKEFQGFGTLFHAYSMKSANAICRLLADSERPSPGDIQVWWPFQNGKISHTTLSASKASSRLSRLELAKDLSLRMAELFQEPLTFNLYRDRRNIYRAQEREKSKLEFEEALRSAQNNGEANDIVNLYSNENGKLKERISELEDENRRERAKNEYLLQRINELSETSTNPKVLPRIPQDIADSVKIASEESQYLLFLPSAFASAKDNLYRNPIEVLEALKTLNQAAETSISNRNRLGASLANWLKNRGYDYGDGISETTSKEDRKQYDFIYEERIFTCEKHLRIGSGRHSDRDCLRIYFSSDPYNKKWIVAHVGEHLNCAST